MTERVTREQEIRRLSKNILMLLVCAVLALLLAASCSEAGDEGQQSAERGSSEGSGAGEGSVQSSDNAGDFEDEENTASGSNPQELASQYRALNEELTTMYEDLEARIAQLEDPEVDLEEALGPDTRNPDTFDCASDPVSCVVAEYENQLSQDRETFEEVGYGRAGCSEVSEPDYYAEIRDFDSAGGSAYITERERISTNAENLGQHAQDTLAKARAAEEARQRVVNSNYSGMLPEVNAGTAEVEPLIEDAENAETQAEEAITEAEQRYGAYESRAEQALAEAEALYARAGCAIEET